MKIDHYLYCFVISFVEPAPIVFMTILAIFTQADDEHSDWPGPEPGLSVMQLTDEEIDPEISFSSRKLVGPGKGRVMRAGSRRLKSANRSPPYGEMLQRFLP